MCVFRCSRPELRSVAEVCPAWALDWRWKSFTGRVGSNREPEATARSVVRRETRDAGAAIRRQDQQPFIGEHLERFAQRCQRLGYQRGHEQRRARPRTAYPSPQRFLLGVGEAVDLVVDEQLFAIRQLQLREHLFLGVGHHHGSHADPCGGRGG